jgi:hypothetical protein
MKKLFVLVAALLLVGMVAAASDVTLSGEVESRYLHDLNNKSYTESPVVEVKLDAVVDETASLYIELEEAAANIGPNFDKAHFTLDIAAIFDLPVGVTFRTGWDEYDLFDAVKVTMGEIEDVIGTDWQNWGHELNIDVNEMIAVRALWANDAGIKGFSIGAAVTYDPVYVEVGYVEIGSGEIDGDMGKGNIEAGVEFAMDVADGMNVAAAATVEYDLNEATTDDTAIDYGAGAKFTYDEKYAFAASVVGFTGATGDIDSELNAAQLGVEAVLTEMLTVYLFAGLGLDSDLYDNTFDSFEGSVKVMIGPSTWYVGMLYIDELGAGIASEKGDFAPEDPDSMNIFIRGELKY